MNRFVHATGIFLGCGSAFWILLASPAAAQSLEREEFFERRIRPLLFERCGTCHGDTVQMAGLKLTSAEGFLRGAAGTPVIVKGEPGQSRLIRAVRYDGQIKMPPTGKLDDSDIRALERWVEKGAAWPTPTPQLLREQEGGQAAWSQRQLSHWSFKPPASDLALPAVHNEQWIRNEVDRFVLSRLEAASMQPAAEANKLTLLRRAKYDLHGLPPTEGEARDFLFDTAPDAFERLVERLLASPRYGEKWGRHWLDVARYSDVSPHAWRYRDYVIDAFNRDLPYNRFVQEQIAGDLLAPGNTGRPYVRGIIATGFLALGPRQVNEQDKTKLRYDVIDEQIDTTSKAFVGLTIACSRCHDHKFDPISTQEYYSLASIFADTQSWEVLDVRDSTLYHSALVAEADFERYRQSKYNVDAKEQEIEAFLANEVLDYTLEEYYPRVADYMLAEWRVRAHGSSPQAEAAVKDLDESVLGKWIEYLGPSDSHADYKVFLEPWHRTAAQDASQESVEEAARHFQAIFDIPAKRWVNDVRSWKDKLDEAIASKAKLPEAARIEAKRFDSVNDRFFVEVALPAFESNECRFFNKDLCGPAPFLLEGEAREQVLSQAARSHLSRLRQELDALQSHAPKLPPMACSVTEGKPVEQRVFHRGQPSNPGPVVAKGFPLVLSRRGAPPAVEGSGRLALAEWLTDPGHPLTARVMVNRIWQWHFGEGLVRTPNNFGLTGEPPTHSALLDYLAVRFVRSGWSLKAMHRLMMHSSTYRTDSRTSAESWNADPGNHLWSRFNRRRLTAEEFRDSLLSLDGALDLGVGGRLEPEPATDGESRKPFTLASSRRRTIYFPLSRTRLPATLRTFDFGDASTSTAKRQRTTVAPQALYFMNSPFVLERTEDFARSLLTMRAGSDPARVESAYQMALGRPATPAEVTSARSFLERYPVGANPADPRVDAWAGLCRLLISSNAFQHVD